jgi:endoglucanase
MTPHGFAARRRLRRPGRVSPGIAAAALAVALAGPGAAHADPAGPEQVVNGHFDRGTASWSAYATTSFGVVDGEGCALVPGGLANAWDAGVVQDLPLVAGSAYTLTFRARASAPLPIRVVVQSADAPYTSTFEDRPAVAAGPATYTYTFTSGLGTDRGQLAFQIGGAPVENTVCLDDVSLAGGVQRPRYVPDTGPRVRVNQVGYLPRGPKNATLVTDATGALPWQLRDAAGQVVAAGQSTPRGVDEASGQRVHTIDFSAFTQPGTGYTLVADGQTSYPFDLTGDVYRPLRSDSLLFFYLQRSGIAIDANLVGQQYARPAGHLGVDPNTGDTSVPCQPGTCDYRLDVRGGWYDAGDQGKYVINGGITAYQLLNILERTRTAVTGNFGAALGDGSLRVPERGNGVPDILDEARWELDFLLRMQVPAGQPLAGMAHHKIHDRNWTALPMLPHNDPELRELHPPTTAATLNLAAVGAQCGRVLAPYDAAFARRCLASARTAYAAAEAHPSLYAPESDSVGGGSYADGDATDEFYWAAVELYLTTGETQYLSDLSVSPHQTGNVFDPTGFGWLHTAALGRLDLATVPSGLSTAERQRVRQSVVTAADGYLQLLGGQAYGLPLPGAPWAYFWGSNSNIMNNGVVLATAYDLTGNLAYRDAALQGMDYIFGRNALNQSYVTGWGEKATEHQHGRIFARDLDPNLPGPPPGATTGGANASLFDPYAVQLLDGCKPMFCYIDNIQSYSTNEVAINYQSALAWMASFQADQGDGRSPAPGDCQVRYTRSATSPGGAFAGRITLINTGSTPVNGWALRFAFLADQRVTAASGATVTQTGAVVTLGNTRAHPRLNPGASITVGFTATGTGANPAPGLFTLNGGACTIA